jgi:hypothetical protein
MYTYIRGFVQQMNSFATNLKHEERAGLTQLT